MSQWRVNSANIIYDEDRFTDSFFVRTIRGRDNDINKAYEMFTNYLKYREENSSKIKEYCEANREYMKEYNKRRKELKELEKKV